MRDRFIDHDSDQTEEERMDQFGTALAILLPLAGGMLVLLAYLVYRVTA